MPCTTRAAFECPANRACGRTRHHAEIKCDVHVKMSRRRSRQVVPGVGESEVDENPNPVSDFLREFINGEMLETYFLIIVGIIMFIAIVFSFCNVARGDVSADDKDATTKLKNKRSEAKNAMDLTCAPFAVVIALLLYISYFNKESQAVQTHKTAFICLAVLFFVQFALSIHILYKANPGCDKNQAEQEQETQNIKHDSLVSTILSVVACVLLVGMLLWKRKNKGKSTSELDVPMALRMSAG